MGQEQVYEKVKFLLEAALERDMLDSEMNRKISQLGVDSLDLVTVTNGLEQWFEIDIPSKDLGKLMAGTGNQLVDYVKSKHG